METEHRNIEAVVRVLGVVALAKQAPAYAQDRPGAKEGLLKTLRGILDLYQNHIWKEDAVVFPMADKVLTAADQKELTEQFAEVDQAVGLDVVARLVTFARSLATIPLAPLSSAAGSGGCNCGCGP